MPEAATERVALWPEEMVWLWGWTEIEGTVQPLLTVIEPDFEHELAPARLAVMVQG